MVVDNASRDGSREVIERCRAEIGSLKTIFLDENLGGEAINLALERVTGDLIHITENDQVFLDGWSQHVRDCFSAFAGLGQLSLHAAVPTDDEAGKRALVSASGRQNRLRSRTARRDCVL